MHFMVLEVIAGVYAGQVPQDSVLLARSHYFITDTVKVQIDRETDRETKRQRDKETERQRYGDRKTKRQTR